MDRSVNGGLYGEARRFFEDADTRRSLDRFEGWLRRCGATHLLVTGLPMPRRSMAKLLVRFDWPDMRGGGPLLDVSPTDALLGCCLAHPRPFFIRDGRSHPDCPPSEMPLAIEEPVGPSELLAAAGGRSAVLIAVPIHDLLPWQGCVLVAGPELSVEPASLGELEYFCRAALRSLIRQGRIDAARPGDLSERERHVLRLTAIGKTAAEIAALLEISQRTVHAHLQNAGEKMDASNKTHTVMQALRHGQIRL